MPSSILSHQAPAILIKLKYPNKIDGTAICISTIVPDLNIFFDFLIPGFFRNLSHSLLGLVLWTIPLSLGFTMLFSRHIAPFLAKVSQKKRWFYNQWKYLGIDKWNLLKSKQFNRSFYLRASISAFLGGLTHLLLDLPAHEYIELFYPFIILKMPDFMLTSLAYYGTVAIGTRKVHLLLTVYNLIWFLETMIFAVPTLYSLRYIAKKGLLEQWYLTTPNAQK